MKGLEAKVFEKFKILINDKNIGQTITRKEILEMMNQYFRMGLNKFETTNQSDNNENRIFIDKTVVDLVRIRLTKYSVLKSTSIQGIYSIISHIPETMSWKEFNDLYKKDEIKPWSQFNV